MMTDTDALFTQILEDAGIPTTADAIQAQWDRLNDDSDIRITNDSSWSPFWRLISAMVTTPAQWVVNLLIASVLPNMFLKYATGTWLDILGWAVDLERKAATKAKGHLLFTRESSDGELTIEAGVLVATPAINGIIYRVVVTEATTLNDGVLSGLVPAHAENAGSEYNLGPGYYSVLPEPIDGIVSVTNESDWLSVAGADAEEDDDFRLRCKTQFSAVGQYHHDAAYRADIASFAGIQADYIWFEHDAPRGAGSANAYIMIDSGIPSQEFVDSINTYIVNEGHHGHGDDMLCMPMPDLPQTLVVTAYHSSVLSAEGKTALQAGVTDIIRYAFRENQSYDGLKITRTMPFSRFSFSTMAMELHDQLPNLSSVTFSLADIVSGMELATLNSLTVNLEEV